jgi:hypothetical protein
VADGGTGASDAATARTNLGLAIGTNVQAYDADLAAIAALTPTADNFIVGNGTTWTLETPAQARTSLGLGTISTQDASSVAITGGSINGTTVGATTATSGRFTTLEATGVTTVSAGTVSAPAITTSGDTNTGIFFPAADTIAFTEGGSEALRINSSAQIAVNTAGSASAPVITKTDDLNTGIFFPAADTIAFAEGGAEAMRINDAGEVLVGGSTSINAANGCLTVQRTNDDPYFALFRNDTSIVNGNRIGNIDWYVNDTTSNTPTRVAYILGAASGDHSAGSNPTDLTFATTASGSATVTERMRINSSGNIGFGTDTPTGAGKIFHIHNPGTSGADVTDLRFTTGTTGATSGDGVRIRLANVGDLDINNLESNAVLISTANTERMRIDSSGNVGIGTTGYGTYATTRKAISLGEGSTISAAASGGDPYITIASNAYFTSTPDWKYVASDFASMYEQYNGTHVWQTAASGTAGNAITFSERMRITSGGNLGIGTSSPLALLDVNGVSLFRDVMYGYQPSPTSLAVNTTLSVAQLLTGIIQVTAAAVTITMPTATTLDSGLLASLPTNGSIDFSVIHTGGGSPPSIAANTGVTIVGNANIASGGNSGRFRLRKSATSTYVVYRL